EREAKLERARRRFEVDPLQEAREATHALAKRRPLPGIARIQARDRLHALRHVAAELEAAAAGERCRGPGMLGVERNLSPQPERLQELRRNPAFVEPGVIAAAKNDRFTAGL